MKYNYKTGTNTQDRLVAYDYDANGNRETVGDNGVTTSYTANTLNQYTAAGSLTPSYDTNGNMAGQGGWAYTYDAQNRLTSAHKGSGTVTFAYDARNRCVSRALNSASTYFSYDGWRLIEERDASATLVASYVDGPQIDDLIAIIGAAGTSYYHQDALDSVVALSAATTGKVVERYSYDIYGSPTAKGPAGQTRGSSLYGNRFLFTGREYISQIALYDYRNRMYPPSYGRFLQTDPKRFGAGDFNLYRYALNSPTDWIDPDGLKTCWKHLSKITHYGDEAKDKEGIRGHKMRDGDVAVGQRSADRFIRGRTDQEVEANQDKYMVNPYGSEINLYPDGGRPGDIR